MRGRNRGGCNAVLSSDGSSLTYASITYDTGVAWDTQISHFAQSAGDTVGIGGRVRRQQADAAFCAGNGVSYPCGSRAFVQINWNKWVGNIPGAGGATTGDSYRRREILHETGHSFGLIDCPTSYTGMMTSLWLPLHVESSHSYSAAT